MRIYADNAATTRMSRSVIDAMLPYMERIYGNPSSIYTEGQQAAEALNDARERIASRLGCTAKEITFTSGGSEADNQAIFTAARAGERQGKRHIISSAFEHHAVLHTLDALKKQGFDITLLEIPENGVIETQQVEDAIRDDTCLVTIMYVNNEVGTIQPVEEIGAVCRRRGVLFHTDAVQAAGHIPIDVSRQNIDMLSLSAHKFHGPKGAGALYARRGIGLENVIYGGGQERGKRAGTENVPAVMGMAAALDEACEAMEENRRKLERMGTRLTEGLSLIPHSSLNGDERRRLPGTVNFSFEGIEGETLLLLLDEKGICASSGSACTSGSLDPSHVLIAMGRPNDIAYGSLRLSLSGQNTDEEIGYIIEAVREAVDYLRGVSPAWHDLQSGKREYFFR